MKLRKITVVVSERESPFPPVSPWPLIYDLEVPADGVIGEDPFMDYDSLLRQVADIRYNELVGDDEEQDVEVLDAILDGLELHFAFEGDIRTIADWRS
jgi:hypothetical protein